MARRIRVLMLTATLGYGGSESDFLRLAEYLSRTMDVSIAVMGLDYDRADYSNDRLSTALPIKVLAETAPAGANLFSKVARWSRMLARLRQCKREHDATISFLSGPNLLNALAGEPSLTIVSERGSKRHHVGIGWWRKWLWLAVLDPWVYRRAAAIVPASAGYATEIAKVGGRGAAGRIIPIEGGIDGERLLAESDAPPDADIAAFCDRPTAVFCGRLDHGKGIDLLIPAFSVVRSAMPEARLLIIGDGPLKRELVMGCRINGLVSTDVPGTPADVYLAGYRRQPIRNFRLCKVFLFPSLHEGLGNALIEGVGSGIPVLAADCPWGPRSILAGSPEAGEAAGSEYPLRLVNGSLLPLPNSEAGLAIWASEIELALRAPATRRSLQERRMAIERFCLERTGEHWVRLVQRIAKGAR